MVIQDITRSKAVPWTAKKSLIVLVSLSVALVPIFIVCVLHFSYVLLFSSQYDSAGTTSTPCTSTCQQPYLQLSLHNRRRVLAGPPSMVETEQHSTRETDRRTTLLASVCHESTYDEAACSQLAEVWNLP